MTMSDKPFIDIVERPDLLPPLPEKLIDTDKVMGIARRALRRAGATPRGIFSTFSDMLPTWYLPPRLLKVERETLSPGIGIRDKTVKTLLDVHKQYRELILTEGMNDAVRRELAAYFTTGADHPLVFSSTKPGKEASNLFSLELISALNTPRSYTSIHGDCILRNFPGKSSAYSKIALSRYAGHGVSEEWIRDKLTEYRGVAVYGTYDIFDRCLDWARSNIPKNNRLGIEASLSWLKAYQNKAHAYDFEQMIFSLEPLEASQDEVPYPESSPKQKEQKHTYEALNQAKEIWFAESVQPYTAFRNFYSFLVPRLLDHMEFARIFKVGLVGEVNFSEEIQSKIDTQLQNLELFFTRKMREYER